MGKVTRLFTDKDRTQQELVNRLEEVIEMAKNGELKNIILAGEMTNGEVVTGYANADVVERQFLVSNMQIDINYQVVENTLLGE